MNSARQVLADTFFMYLKAHTYHWNVEGINFPQLHGFFGDLYGDLHGAVDPLAEEIRALNEYAPRNIDELYNSKSIDVTNSALTSRDMVADLLQTNDQVLSSLNTLMAELTTLNQQGFMDFVASRIDAHKKHGWMLRSILKGE